MLLGLIEGLTEFLPVSSTGHLLLAEQWVGARSDVFNVVIQSGAVLAVLFVFAGRVRDFATTLSHRATQVYLGQLALSFVITAIGGLGLKAAHFKLPETAVPVAWATLLGGIFLWAVERYVRGHVSPPHDAAVGWRLAIIFGVAQLFAAVFPGLSRSGTTIMFALALGCSRAQAAEFSFLLGVPTLLAAGGFELLHAIKDNEPHEPWGILALASAVAAVTAFTVVKWLMGYVRNHSFMPFALYRIALGGVLLAYAMGVGR